MSEDKDKKDIYIEGDVQGEHINIGGDQRIYAPGKDRDETQNPNAYVNIGGQQRIFFIQGDMVYKAGEQKIPFMAPDLPPTFVNRPDEYGTLLSQLVSDDGNQTIGITSALQGAGGFGKTTLATALCHDKRVQEHYPDGIMWVTLGEQGDTLTGLHKLYGELTGARPAFVDIEDAANELAEELKDRRCLVVIDDVWHITHLRPFLRGGDHCTRLITTRQADIVTGIYAEGIPVDEMETGEAVQLLLSGISEKPDDTTTFVVLAQRLGEWALMLEIANAMLREEMSGGTDLKVALSWVNEVLTEEGVDGIERENAEERKRSAASVLAASFRRLDENDLTRFAELAIFREDTDVYLTSVQALWDLSKVKTKKLIERFARMSFIRFDTSKSAFRMHDVIREVLLSYIGDPAHVHGKVIENYTDRLADDYISNLDNLLYHLENLSRQDEIHDLFRNKTWVTQRARNSLIGILNDFEKVRRMVTPESDLATYLRYKLFADVVKQRYQNFPVEVLPVALEKRLTSPQRLLTDIESMDGDNEAKVRMYIKVYKPDLISEELRKEFSEGILAMVARIYDDQKVSILRDLIPIIHNDIKPDAQQMLWQLIFKANELGENREALRWLLGQQLSDEQLERLKQDAMQIDNIYHRTNIISLIAFRYPSSLQQDLWQNIYDSRLKGRSAYERGKIFSFVVTRLPKYLQTKASSEILDVLFAISDETGDWDDPVFYSKLLHPLLPLVPLSDIPVLWERAKYEVRERDSGWGTRPLRDIIALTPTENILDDFEFDIDEDETDPGVETCIKLALLHRLSSEEQQIKTALETWQTIWLSDLDNTRCVQDVAEYLMAKLHPNVVVELWNATLVLYQKEHEKKRLEGDFSENFKRRYEQSAGKMLTILAPNLPVEFIPSACLQCSASYVRSVLQYWKDFSWLDVVALLMDRIENTEDKSIIWENLFSKVLKEPVNYGYDKIDVKGAVKLIWLMPQTLQEESWDQVLNTIYSITNPRTRMYDMVDMLEILPSHLKSKMWLDAWEIAIGSNDKDLPLAVIGSFKNVYSHLSSEHLAVISDFDWMNSWWSNSIIDTVVAVPRYSLFQKEEGVALLLQFAPPQVKEKMWIAIRANKSTILSQQYLLTALFPFIPVPDRQEALKQFRHIGHQENLVDDSLKIIVKGWPEEVIWQVWEYMHECLMKDGLNWPADEWRGFLTAFLSESYCIKAWEKHTQMLKYSDGFYENIAIHLVENLPSGYLPQAWNDVDENAYYKQEIKTAIAPRLPEDFILKLVQHEPSLPQLPEQDIFTCSMANYIRHGGPWLTIDWRTENKKIIIEPWSVGYQYRDDYEIQREKHQAEVSNFLEKYAYFGNLTVPIALIFLIIIQPSKWALDLLDQASDAIAKTVKIYILWRIFMLPVRLVLFPFILPLIFYWYMYQWLENRSQNGASSWKRVFKIFTILFKNKIAHYHFNYFLNKKVARLELVDAKDIVELSSKRPLLQIVGGKELRNSIQQSYADAYGWWRDSLKG